MTTSSDSYRQPDVTVVIPAYNAAATVAETLLSVTRQSHQNYEVVVIDDGSTDGTSEIVTSTKDDRIRLIRTPNAGVAEARNLGIRSARASLIALLDADDLWEPQKLQHQIDAMAARPDAGMCFCAARRVDGELRPSGVIPAVEYPDYTHALLLYATVIPAPCSSIVVRRNVALAIGGFDSRFSQTADWDFLIRLSAATQFVAVREPMVLYRVHSSNMSRDPRLLERDTFGVLAKTLDDPAFVRFETIRARALSNHSMICAGSYLHAGRLFSAVRCLLRGLRLYPANVRRPLGLPGRWLRRIRLRAAS
jgi:glycosyltransferase involved in cell wall biosynthesis